jgi:hypothetical protein
MAEERDDGCGDCGQCEQRDEGAAPLHVLESSRVLSTPVVTDELAGATVPLGTPVTSRE